MNKLNDVDSGVMNSNIYTYYDWGVKVSIDWVEIIFDVAVDVTNI